MLTQAEARKLIRQGITNWAKPFMVGDIVEVNGLQMEVVKIKKLRQELHLKLYTLPFIDKEV